MKTTNKLILGLFALILIVVTLLMVMVKTSLNSMERIEGSGIIITEEKRMDAYTGIQISGNFHITLHQSDNHAISIETDDNFMEYISAEVKNNVLIIKFQKQNGVYLFPRKHISISAYVKDLTELDVSSGARITTENKLVGQSMQLQVLAGAQAELALAYEELSVEAHAGSDVSLSGSVDKLQVESYAGAHVKAAELMAKTAHVTTNAGAQVDVFVTESISGKANSGSQIRYSGNPAHTNLTTNSGGSIIEGKMSYN